MFSVPSDVSGLGHCVTQAPRLPLGRLKEASCRMTKRFPWASRRTLRGRHSTSVPDHVFHRTRPAASQARPEGHEAAARPVRRSSHLRTLSLRCRAEETAQDCGARRLRTRLGTATASLRPRPDRRVTRRLCRRGSPCPGEAGRWEWNPERRVWQLRYDRVIALGLNSRIVEEPASNSGCPGSSGENLHADARAPSR